MGLSDKEFDVLFTTDKPIIFAYHGYPLLIHRLTYRRTNHHNLHVRGYKEEGTTTTPFDMVVLNDLDRFHLVADVIDRVPALGPRAAYAQQAIRDKLIEHKQYIARHGEDMPEIRNWRWSLGQRRPHDDGHQAHGDARGRDRHTSHAAPGDAAGASGASGDDAIPTRTWCRRHMAYAAGSTSSVNSMHDHRPPTTGAAVRAETSAPTPASQSSGSNPSPVVATVIMSGRTRALAPSTTAASTSAGV